jgi:ribonuclease T
MALTLFFSLDVEASGPVPGIFSLLAIGGCVVADDGNEARLLDGADNEFKVLVKPLEGAKVDEQALLHAGGLVPEELVRTGTPPRDALLMLNRALDVPCPFGFAGIDIKAFAMGALGITWEETAKDALGRRVGLEAVDPLRLHEPLYDAHYQARLFANLINTRRRLASFVDQKRAE